MVFYIILWKEAKNICFIKQNLELFNILDKCEIRLHYRIVKGG